MKKGQIQVMNSDNFSDLSHIFFKKQARDESASLTLDITLKKLKTFQSQSAVPMLSNESVTSNIKKQMFNQINSQAHSQGDQSEVVIQSIKKDILNIHNYLPQETVEKAKNHEQPKEEQQKEQNQMALEASDIRLVQKQFFCEICQKQYKNKKTYNSHVQTKHNDTKPFLCVICQKGFKRPDYLQKHKESHKQDKEIPCNECDKKFKSRHTHEKHVKTVHAKIICGMCQCCNRGFTRMDYLKKHLQRGKQNYQYAHQECGIKFASKQSMERHNTTVHQG